MNTRTFLGLAAVLVATSMPAIGSAQRHHNSNRVVGGYQRGPFYPSWVPGASQRYVGSGASITFGSGGGYYGYAPSYYGYGYNPYGYGYNDGYGNYGYGYVAPSYTYGATYLPGFGYVPKNRYTPGRHLYRHR